MSTQSERYVPARGTKTAERKITRNWLSGQIHQHVLRRVFRRLCRTTPNHRSTMPTESQRKLVLTGLMLGCLSIFAAIFPLCGLPISISGLLISFYCRRTTSLQVMSTSAFVLSLAGLVLSLILTITTISIFFSNYLFSS